MVILRGIILLKKFSNNQKIDIIVKEINTINYPTRSKRPLNSRMKKNDIKLRSWQEALNHYLRGFDND